MGFLDIFKIEDKFKYIIFTLLISAVLYFITGNAKIFIITSIVVVGIYIYYMFREGYNEVKYNYSGNQKKYNELFKEEQTHEKLVDPNIKAKMFNDPAKFYWDRNWEVKDTSPFGFCSEPVKSVEFAEWCYGLKPEITTGNEYDKNSLRVKDTCKNGSIYMNTPELGAFDRLTCKGHL